MAQRYYVFLAEIPVTTGSNDTIIVNDGSDQTATLDAGSYYMRGDSAAGDLLGAMNTKIGAAITPTIDASSLTLDVDPANQSATMSQTYSTSVSLKSTGTFPITDVGYAGTTTGSVVASSLSSKFCFVAPEPPTLDDWFADGAVAQTRTNGGTVRTTELSGPHEDRRIDFAMLDPERVLKTKNTADENATFEAFWAYVRGGKEFEVHSAESDIGVTTLAALDSTTLIGKFHLAQESASTFLPQRHSPGLELYSFPLTLLNNGDGTSAPTGGTGVVPGGAPFAGGAQSSSDLLALCQLMATKDDSVGPQTGDTLTINGVSLAPYDYLIQDAAEVVSSYQNADYFASAVNDTRCDLLVFKSDLTINSGQVFKSTARKPFTVIYVGGDLTVTGDISATARGADHSTATGSSLTAGAIRIATGTYGGVTNPEIPAAGGAGGDSSGSGTGVTGTAGSAGGTGGGGASAVSVTAGGDGAAGTGYSGGAGGAANLGAVGPAASNDGQADGGAGGIGDDVGGAGNHGGGGGAGNPGGAGYLRGTGTGSTGVDGTGGCLVIFVEGTYSGAGGVAADGSAGGAATGTNSARGGSGSGGGSITVICATDTGPTPTAAGGAGGSATVSGGAGGAGTARVLTGI